MEFFFLQTDYKKMIESKGFEWFRPLDIIFHNIFENNSIF